MDATKVNHLIDTFEGLTPEEQGEALKQLLSSIAKRTWVILGNPGSGKTVTEDILKHGAYVLDGLSEESSTWGEHLVSLVESLDFGDYSNAIDSVEHIRKQRAEQRARRLGREN